VTMFNKDPEPRTTTTFKDHFLGGRVLVGISRLLPTDNSAALRFKGADLPASFWPATNYTPNRAEGPQVGKSNLRRLFWWRSCDERWASE